jgi:hypothetical protein
MAKQNSILKVKGNLGGISFYKGKSGNNKTTHLAREAGGVDRQRILNDPNFSRVRENMSEFALAGEQSKLIYRAMNEITEGARDRNASSRLTGLLRMNLEKDAANARGERQVQWNNIAEIAQYQFNAGRNFESSFGGKVSVEKGTADVVVKIGDVKPMYDVHNASAATHYKLQVCVMTVDVDGVVTTSYCDTDFQSTTDTAVVSTADCTFTDAATDAVTIITGVSIKFYQELNSVKYELNNKSYNSAKLLPVLA